MSEVFKSFLIETKNIVFFELISKKSNFFFKHLSIISFKPEALLKFAKAKKSRLEKIEDIELLRALEIGLKIKTVVLKGDSFSVDVAEDYVRAKDRMPKDKFFKLYK